MKTRFLKPFLFVFLCTLSFYQLHAQGEGGGTCGKGMCMNNKGQIFHVGITGENLFNSNQGKHDIFIVKLALEK